MGILKLSEKFVLFCQPIWSPHHVWLRTRQWWPNCKLKTCVSLPHKHRKRLDNLYNIQLNCSLPKGPCHETANITNTSFYDFSVYRTPETQLPRPILPILPFNWQTWTTPKSHSALKYLPLYENLMLFCKDGLGDSNIPMQEIGNASPSPAAILKILLWVVWERAVDLWVGGEGKKGKQGKGGWVTLEFTWSMI